VIKATREELEKVIAQAEYHRDLPHAFREEVLQAQLVIDGAKRELAQLDKTHEGFDAFRKEGGEFGQ
jgi:hypothetical protein